MVSPFFGEHGLTAPGRFISRKSQYQCHLVETAIGVGAILTMGCELRLNFPKKGRVDKWKAVSS